MDEGETKVVTLSKLRRERTSNKAAEAGIMSQSNAKNQHHGSIGSIGNAKDPAATHIDTLDTLDILDRVSLPRGRRVKPRIVVLRDDDNEDER